MPLSHKLQAITLFIDSKVMPSINSLTPAVAHLMTQLAYHGSDFQPGCVLIWDSFVASFLRATNGQLDKWKRAGKEVEDELELEIWFHEQLGWMEDSYKSYFSRITVPLISSDYVQENACSPWFWGLVLGDW